jgi:hypothetical protein
MVTIDSLLANLEHLGDRLGVDVRGRIEPGERSVLVELSEAAIAWNGGRSWQASSQRAAR